MALPDLAAPWRLWIVRSLALGEEPEAIEKVLHGQGLCETDAREAVQSVLDQPGFAEVVRAMRPMALASRLRQEHLRLGSPRIERHDRTVPFVDRVAAQLPVVLTDLTAGWPALEWTWEDLAQRFGDLIVPVCMGRTSHPRAYLEPKLTEQQRRFDEVIALLLDPATGDDVYVVANNEALEGPLKGMLDDVRAVDGILPADRLVESSAWIGAAGAFTPLHHDTSDILLVPFLGRKQVVLVPPEELEVSFAAQGFWADGYDLDDPDVARRETIVQPGEALLIPSGWWHQVRSLEPSLTLTFAGLGHPNSFRWYTPGSKP